MTPSPSSPPPIVIPAQAGIHSGLSAVLTGSHSCAPHFVWIPAFAGMTAVGYGA